MINEQTVRCEGFVYRKPSEQQLKIAIERCPWLLETEKIINLREEGA